MMDSESVATLQIRFFLKYPAAMTLPVLCPV